MIHLTAPDLYEPFDPAFSSQVFIHLYCPVCRASWAIFETISPSTTPSYQIVFRNCSQHGNGRLLAPQPGHFAAFIAKLNWREWPKEVLVEELRNWRNLEGQSNANY